MTTETTWQHSWPLPVAVAIVLAAALAAWTLWIYRWEPYGSRKLLRAAFVALRTAALWLAVWMMFGWSRQEHRTEPAELVIALDDSASMAYAEDAWGAAAEARVRRLANTENSTGVSRFALARALLDHPRYGWSQKLQDRYRVRLFTFADSVRELDSSDPPELSGLEANRPASLLGAGLQELLENQQGRPTAAIVLLTDGVTTAGPSLGDMADAARQRAIPIFVVGVGSSAAVRDLRIGDVLADEVAFVDDLVTLSCHVQATGFAGQRCLVRLSRTDTNETLAEQELPIAKDDERIPARLSFRARAAGEYPLLVSAVPLPGEVDLENNESRHRLDVHDATVRVLIVQAAPSYEFRHVQNLLNRAIKPGTSPAEKAFSVTTILQEADREWIELEPAAAEGFPIRGEELFEYDVVIFGDADPALLGTPAMEDLVEFVRDKAGGVIFSAGPRYLPAAYRGTPLAAMFPFQMDTVSLPGPGPLERPFPVRLTPVGQLLPPCQLLTDPAENVTRWGQLPELYWNVDIPDPSPASRVLLERAGSEGPARPLVMLQYFGAGRVVFHATDETYRWSRFEGTDEYYERYWMQMIRYACRSKLLRDRSPAAIMVDKQRFAPGEPIRIRVQFHQPGLAPQPPTPVSVALEPARGPRQTLALAPSDGSVAVFSGTTSDLTPGRYRIWLAFPLLERPPTPAELEVAPPMQEQVAQPMNAADLEQAARISGGRFYAIETADRLPAHLPQGQRVRIDSLPQQPLWNSRWVAGLFIALLTAEWFLRKRVGLL